MSSEPLVSVRNLTVDYVGDNAIARAVNGIDFDIGRGEAFGLAGESGCGKSTVAFALARLTRLPGLVSGGSIRFDGEEVLDFDRARLNAYRWSEVSFVFQSAMNALNPVITDRRADQDVIDAHRPRASRHETRARAAEMFELVGISPRRLDDYPHQFSGGMRQRICIAMALVLESEAHHHGRADHRARRRGAARHHRADLRTEDRSLVFRCCSSPTISA